MLSGQVPVSYDIGALVNANVNVRPFYPHDDIVSAIPQHHHVPLDSQLSPAHILLLAQEVPDTFDRTPQSLVSDYSYLNTLFD